jgi:hypothetical protein
MCQDARDTHQLLGKEALARARLLQEVGLRLDLLL